MNTYLIKLTHKLNTCKKEHEFFEDNHVCPVCTQDLADDFREEKIASGKNKVDEMTIGWNDLNAASNKKKIGSQNLLSYLQK